MTFSIIFCGNNKKLQLKDMCSSSRHLSYTMVPAKSNKRDLAAPNFESVRISLTLFLNEIHILLELFLTQIVLKFVMH